MRTLNQLPMRATRFTHLILLDIITIMIFYKTVQSMHDKSEHFVSRERQIEQMSKQVS